MHVAKCMHLNLRLKSNHCSNKNTGVVIRIKHQGQGLGGWSFFFGDVGGKHVKLELVKQISQDCNYCKMLRNSWHGFYDESIKCHILQG